MNKNLDLNTENILPNLTEKKWQSIAKKIERKEDEYAKLEVVEEIVDYNSDIVIKLIWFLLKKGYLDFGNNYLLWRNLSENLENINSEEFVKIIKNLHLSDKDAQDLADYYEEFYFWNNDLDAILMNLYAQDPKPFDDNIATFNPNVKEHIQLVQIRFGNLKKEELNKNVLKKLAKLYLKGEFGVMVSSKEGTFINIWMQENNVAKETNISDTKITYLPNDNFYRLINLLSTKEKWQRELLKQGLDFDDEINSYRITDALKIANNKEFSDLFLKTKLDINAYYWLLNELGNFTIKDLEEIANNIKDDWSKERIEIIIVKLILKRKKEKSEIPQWYYEYITFKAFSKNYHPNSKNYFEGYEYLKEALEYLPKDKSKEIFNKKLEDYDYRNCFPFLYLTNDDFKNSALTKLYEDNKKKLSLNNEFMVYKGLAYIEDLDWFVEKLNSAQNKSMLQLLSLGMINAFENLANKNIIWDKKYDNFIKLHYWKPDAYTDYYDSYISSSMIKTVWSLPYERQNNVLLNNLDSNEKTFIRIFSLFNANTSDEIIRKALKIVAKKGFAKVGKNWFEFTFQNELSKRKKELFTYCLEQEPISEVLKKMEYLYGMNDFKELKKKIAKKGTVIAKEKTYIEELNDLCKIYFKNNPTADKTTIYILQENKKISATNITLNKIGGKAMGVPKDKIPMLDDEYMEHIFTLDIKSVPELAKKMNDNIAAISLFMSDPRNNKAWEPNNKYTELLFISKEDIKQSFFADIKLRTQSDVKTFSSDKVIIPSELFFSEDEDLLEIKNKLWQSPAYVLGNPIWLQEEAYTGEFIMQFNEFFTDINLGDSGEMYVFKETAFWQCY